MYVKLSGQGPNPVQLMFYWLTPNKHSNAPDYTLVRSKTRWQWTVHTPNLKGNLQQIVLRHILVVDPVWLSIVLTKSIEVITCIQPVCEGLG
jgi:hypothetical protein